MRTRVLFPTPAVLRRMAAHLRRGGLVAVPTETVYGLAANALDAKACRGIFRAKKRPPNDPLIVHVAGPAAARLLCEWNDAASALAQAFWPGPLTIVLPKRSSIPAIVTSGGASVALRCPNHPIMRRLLRLAKVPLAAPSANSFGYVSPTSAVHVLDGLGGRIPYVIDGGPSRIGVESTIVDLRDPARPTILRPGAVTRAQIAAVLGVRVRTRSGSKQQAIVAAPGMLPQHYSPRTPVILTTDAQLRRRMARLSADEVAVFFRKPASRLKSRGGVLWLAEHGHAAEAAHNLYKVLRELDGRRLRQAHVALAPVSAGALGEAINDRLRRAAHRPA